MCSTSPMEKNTHKKLNLKKLKIQDCVLSTSIKFPTLGHFFPLSAQAQFHSLFFFPDLTPDFFFFKFAANCFLCVYLHLCDLSIASR